MTPTDSLTCRCGRVHIKLSGEPMVCADCCCSSCQSAAQRLARLPGAPKLPGPFGETRFVLYRKDRVHLPGSSSNLYAFRLSTRATTRRVVAQCCNTPLFLEFKGGHWLSLYGALWPDGTRPRAQLRTMTRDLPNRAALPDDIPNCSTHSFGFYRRLFGAWVAMGLRSPTIDVEGELDASI